MWLSKIPKYDSKALHVNFSKKKIFVPLPYNKMCQKLTCRPLLLYWGIFYGHVRVPDALKPLHTQFQGTGTNFYFFEKSMRGPLRVRVDFSKKNSNLSQNLEIGYVGVLRRQEHEYGHRKSPRIIVRVYMSIFQKK